MTHCQHPSAIRRFVALVVVSCIVACAAPALAGVTVSPSNIDFGLQPGWMFGNSGMPPDYYQLLQWPPFPQVVTTDHRVVEFTNTGPEVVRILGFVQHGLFMAPTCYGTCNVIFPRLVCTNNEYSFASYSFPIVVAAGEVCQFTVYHASNGLGPKSGSLDILTDLPNSPHTVSSTSVEGTNLYVADTVSSGEIAMVRFDNSPVDRCPMVVAEWLPVPGAPGSVGTTGLPSGAFVPFGVFHFETSQCVPNATRSVDFDFVRNLPAGTQLWAYGKTAANNTPHWFVIPATIEARRASFSLTDGVAGDADLTANGLFVSYLAFVFPASQEVHRVPTLTPAALALLGLCIAGLGFWYRKQ